MKFEHKEDFGSVCYPTEVDEFLEMIWAIGCDYDGYDDVKNLKELIDELVKYACEARVALREGKLFGVNVRTNSEALRNMNDDDLAVALSNHFRFTDEETPGETLNWLKLSFELNETTSSGNLYKKPDFSQQDGSHDYD